MKKNRKDKGLHIYILENLKINYWYCIPASKTGTQKRIPDTTNPIDDGMLCIEQKSCLYQFIIGHF